MCSATTVVPGHPVPPVPKILCFSFVPMIGIVSIMRIILLWLMFSAGVVAVAQMAGKNDRTPSPTNKLQESEKLLVVTTPGWNSVDGTMTRYDRNNGKWVQVGAALPVVVGANGLGWDLSVPAKDRAESLGPLKHEGDGRSPAGVFGLLETFGFGEKGPTSREYIPLTASTECVDDVKSQQYGHIVDRSRVPKVDWESSEKMRQIGVYQLGMVVDYNVSKTVPGNGSCIFLHIWKGMGRGTAGCTAMPQENLEGLVQWVGHKQAALVQMPQAEYERLKKVWGLP